MSSSVRIMTWEFDFAKMRAKIHTRPDAISHDDFCTHIYLIVANGVLSFTYEKAHRVYSIPRPVANTGNSAFDDAVKKAWTDFCFEEHILNSKGEADER
jgi:hypothetical protein